MVHVELTLFFLVIVPFLLVCLFLDPSNFVTLWPLPNPMAVASIAGPVISQQLILSKIPRFDKTALLKSKWCKSWDEIACEFNDSTLRNKNFVTKISFIQKNGKKDYFVRVFQFECHCIKTKYHDSNAIKSKLSIQFTKGFARNNMMIIIIV